MPKPPKNQQQKSQQQPKNQQQQPKNQQQKKSPDNTTKVCSKHGAAHQHDVQSRFDPEWSNIYQYRQICACGDVLSDWHR